jgi:hypothetical protein
MRKTRKPRRLLKKLSRPRGGDSRKKGSWQGGPALVDEHIRKSAADAEKRLEAAIAESALTSTGGDAGMTVHHSLATGRTVTMDAPNQGGEGRFILDASCERDKLAATGYLVTLIRRCSQWRTR